MTPGEIGVAVGWLVAVGCAVGGDAVVLGDGVGSALPPLSEQAAARSAAAMMLIAANFRYAAMRCSLLRAKCSCLAKSSLPRAGRRRLGVHLGRHGTTLLYGEDVNLNELRIASTTARSGTPSEIMEPPTNMVCPGGNSTQ